MHHRSDFNGAVSNTVGDHKARPHHTQFARPVNTTGPTQFGKAAKPPQRNSDTRFCCLRSLEIAFGNPCNLMFEFGAKARR